MPLGEGTPAPSITAQDQNGDEQSLSFGEPTVLYFYPRDDTPGCTTEAREFDAVTDDFRAEGVTVYGVSTDSVESHREFAEKHGLGFDLLADPDGEIADAFEVERGFGDAVSRTTFVIHDGVIQRVFENVNPEGHAAKIRELLDGMGLLDAEAEFH